MELNDVGPYGDGCRLRGPLDAELRNHKVDEREDFAAVGAKGCWGEVALPFEVFQKCLNQPWPNVEVAHFSPVGRGANFLEAFHHHRRRASPNISVECFTAITREAST